MNVFSKFGCSIHLLQIMKYRSLFLKREDSEWHYIKPVEGLYQASIQHIPSSPVLLMAHPFGRGLSSRIAKACELQGTDYL